MNQSGLRLSLSTTGPSADVHVIRVDGVVDTVTSPELDAVIASLVEQRRFRIILDLAGTNYVSSAGWGIFISRLREIREGGGDLKLARMTEDVKEIYDLLEFDGILPRHDRLESARDAFNGNGNGQRDHHGAESSGAAGSQIHTAVQSVSHSPASSSSMSPVPDSPAAAATFDSALLELVKEDPFYGLGEFKARLMELGYRDVGRWTIWLTLRRHRLWTRRQRFRYCRRQSSGFLTGR
ncbi:MAG: hypothetical protein Kow0074_18730 [Candidatus Zixiibacteriota bacterium]